MLLHHLSHRPPVVVAPTLIDVFVMLFRNAALLENKPCTALHFFQGKGHFGIMSLWPVATTPGLNDCSTLHKIQINSINIPSVCSELSTNLSTDAGFFASKLRMFPSIMRGHEPP